MSAFFNKLFTLFLSDADFTKNEVFALCCEISIAEVKLRFNLIRKSHFAIVELHWASTE